MIRNAYEKLELKLPLIEFRGWADHVTIFANPNLNPLALDLDL